MPNEQKRFRGGTRQPHQSEPAAPAATPALFASPANGRASAGQATDATEAGSGYGIVATTHGDEGANAARAAEERRAELRGITELWMVPRLWKTRRSLRRLFAETRLERMKMQAVGK